MLDSRPHLLATDFPALARGRLETLQVNLGYLCNQSCVHCHVNAGPTRTEQMTRGTVDLVLQFLRRHRLGTLDITGGAPEMNPHFRYLVREARALGVTVIDRCNLTILLHDSHRDLAEFLAAEGVVITASLPCYQEENVAAQRGKGVFADSISALQRLNGLGYGRDPALVLNLVYNPVGATLPPPQAALEADYRRELGRDHGIVFNRLLTLANMPISRFGALLLAHGEFDQYLALLRGSFTAANLATVMCRGLISVDWQGYVYDCDFNQMLGIPLHHPQMLAGEARTHLSELLGQVVDGWPIRVGEHCYGCTAGQGSSCGGALAVG